MAGPDLGIENTGTSLPSSFRDRLDAGRRLAEHLVFLRGENVVVLGLPRGGVPVASEVARRLRAPLDVIVVRKLGVPFQPELAMGAIGEGGVIVLYDPVVKMAGLSGTEMAAVERRERAELDRRAALLRDGRPPLPLGGRTAVVVDDGMATGSTARAACRVARARGAERVILAVPVAAPEAVVDLGREVEVVCLVAPHRLSAVGQWYRDFGPTPEEEVIRLLEVSSEDATSGDPPGDPVVATPGRAGHGTTRFEVEIPAGQRVLPGSLAVPEGAEGLVVFAHGSGSSRHSPRNRFVAGKLNSEGLATLLFDLLTPSEEAQRSSVFDIELLAGRLHEAAAWVRSQPATSGLALGYFGASTGAAAALWAAAEPGADVAAVVSRGGRPDLAEARLANVRAPTLLIVGSRDSEVLRLNRRAQIGLACENRLLVIPGATHLFEEPGALAAAADVAGIWFRRRLVLTRGPAG